MADYYETIAAMRQERNTREQREQLKNIVENHAAMIQSRDQAAAEGDIAGVEEYDIEAEYWEAEYRKVAPPDPGPQFGPEDRRWAAQRRDLDSPLTSAKLQQFENYMEMNRQHNRTAHPDDQRAVFEKGTPQYREALETFYSPGFYDKDGKVIPGTEGAIVPAGYQPMPTPDDVVNDINANSKYGCSADEYNSGLRRLHQMKQQGYYKDRG